MVRQLAEALCALPFVLALTTGCSSSPFESSGGDAGAGGLPFVDSGGGGPDASTRRDAGDSGNPVDSGHADAGGGDGGAHDSGPTCSNDLSNVGTGDFSISFKVQTALGDAGAPAMVALLDQRASCGSGGGAYWSLRMQNGELYVETMAPADGGTAYTHAYSAGPRLDDDAQHGVEVERVSGSLYVLVDGSQVNIGGGSSVASTASFASLPALRVGTDPCAAAVDAGGDGTLDFAATGGTIGDVCVTSSADGGIVAPPSLAISPPNAHIQPAGATIVLTATLTGATGTIQWAPLTAAEGTLSTPTVGSGTSTVTYTSPPTAMPGGQAVQLTASAGNCDAGVDAGGCLEGQAEITVDPLPSDAGSPLGNGVVFLDRVVDFAVLGAPDPSGSTTDNLAVRAPYSVFNVLNTSDPSPGPDKVYLHEGDPSGAFGPATVKVAHSANLDDDFAEETVALTWTPEAWGTTTGGAMATVQILDPTPGDAGSPSYAVLTPALEADGGARTLDPDPRCTTGCNYDYDLALADIDGDGYDEILVSGTITGQLDNSNAQAPVLWNGMVWAFDDLHDSPAGTLRLLWQQPLMGQGFGTSIARIAAGSMRSDGSVQLAVGWFDGMSWVSAWGNGPSPYNQAGIPRVGYQIFNVTGAGATDLTPTPPGAPFPPSETSTSTSAILGNWCYYLQTTNVLGVALADVDADGRKELVIGGWNTYRNNSGTGYWTTVRLQVYDDLDSVTSPTDPAALPLLAASESIPEVRLDTTPGSSGCPGGTCPTINTFAGPYRWLAPMGFVGQPPVCLVDAGTTADGGTNPLCADNSGDAGSEGGLPLAGGGLMSDDLLAGNNVVMYDWTQSDSTRRIVWNAGLPGHDGAYWSYNPTVYTPFDTPDYYYDQTTTDSVDLKIEDVQVGDVNADGLDDLIILWNNGGVRAYGWMCQDTSVPCKKLAWESMSPSFYSNGDSWSPASVSVRNAIIVPTAADNESVTARYNGSHTVIFQSNKVIGVLAGPPVLAGQNTGETTFGTGSSTTFSKGMNFSVSAGVTAGFDVEVMGGVGVETKIGEVKALMHSELELSGAWDNASSQTISTDYSRAEGNDGVLFVTRPYDRYGYTILSSPNPQAVGSNAYIDVPEAPGTRFVPRDYFNRVVNAGQFQINDAILSDVPYDLCTYPRALLPAASGASIDVGLPGNQTVCSTVIPWGVWPAQAVATDPGNSSTGTVDTSTDTTWSADEKFSTDFEAEIDLGSAVTGFNAGFSVGAQQSWSAENSLSFSGQVTGLPVSVWSADQYSWGVQGYKQILTDCSTGAVFQSFFVVSYYVPSRLVCQ